MAKEPCSFVGEADGQGCLPVSALTSVGRDCSFPVGTCFVLHYDRVDEHGHVVDSDDPAAFKCLHHPKEKTMSKTPAAPTAKEDLVDAALAHDEAAPDADLAPDAAEEPPPPLPAPAPAPLAHKTVVEVPSGPPTAINEVKALVGSDGGSMITVLLAAIGVLGGGAGWKFYQSFAKQRHEEKMKQLEIEATRVEKVEAVNAERAADLAEAQRAEKKDDNHQKCSAERLALESKVTALESRLAEAEKAAQEAADAAKAASEAAAAAKQEAAKQDEPELPFNAEDFEGVKERLEQIEKALKKAPPKESKEKESAKEKSKKDKASKA